MVSKHLQEEQDNLDGDQDDNDPFKAGGAAGVG